MTQKYLTIKKNLVLAYISKSTNEKEWEAKLSLCEWHVKVWTVPQIVLKKKVNNVESKCITIPSNTCKNF